MFAAYNISKYQVTCVRVDVCANDFYDSTTNEINVLEVSKMELVQKNHLLCNSRTTDWTYQIMKNVMVNHNRIMIN